jgi:hypothetical protein
MGLVPPPRLIAPLPSADDIAAGFAQIVEAMNEALRQLGRSIIETIEDMMASILPARLSGSWEGAPGMLLEELLDPSALDQVANIRAAS